MSPSKSRKNEDSQLPARQAAALDLLRWFREGSIRYRDRSELAGPQEYGLYRNLVGSAIRFREKYLYYIGQLSGRSLKKLDIEAKVCLLLGLVQLDMLSGVQSYAAVNESVNLTVFLDKPHLKGFINGNLRSFQRKRQQLEAALAGQPLSIRSSHPDWMIERWQRQYGSETAEIICRENNRPPQINIVLKPGLDRDAALRDLQSRHEVVDHHGNGLTLNDAEGLFESEWADSGAFLVQDPSSQQVNNLVRHLPKSRVLDACASPGGKLFHMEWQFSSEIRELVAAEISSRRLPRLISNRDRLNSRAHIIQMDAARPALSSRYDLVLVDAPCSATGTIRKHPELKWQRRPGDISANGARQLEILNGIQTVVDKGGYLLYVTCSLEQEENQEVIGAFAAKNRAFRIIPFSEQEVDPVFITEEGYFQALPRENSMGLFGALLQRRPV